MKKYFMQETDEEVKFGDTIVLDISDDTSKNNVIHHHLECKFIPEIVQLLLEEGIIEEREEVKEKVEKEEDTPSIDFTDDKCPLDDIIQQIEDTELRLDRIENAITGLNSVVLNLRQALSAQQKHRRYGKKHRKQED